MDRIEIFTALAAGMLASGTDPDYLEYTHIKALGRLADAIIANDKQHAEAQQQELTGVGYERH